MSATKEHHHAAIESGQRAATMKNEKYYFENEDATNCWTEEYFQDIMRDNELSEILVLEAIPVKINFSEYIYCKEIGEVGEKSECGKNCPDYSPRNGKNGICKHRGRLYERGDEVTLKRN